VTKQRFDRHRQKKWDAENIASATCRLRVEDYRALQRAAAAQDSSPAMILRRLTGAYLAIIGMLPSNSPLWREIRIDKLITPYFRKKKWLPDAKMGVKAQKTHEKIIKFPKD